MTKLKNLNCDKTNKNSNIDKTKKKSNCDKTEKKTKLWQNSRTQTVIAKSCPESWSVVRVFR